MSSNRLISIAQALCFLLVLSTVLTSPQVHAQSCQSLYVIAPPSSIELKPGQKVFYQHFETDPKATTLVLLPGLNRAVPEDYQAVQSLKSQGYNVVLLATSSHWQSLNSLPASERAAFIAKKNWSRQELQKEAELVIEKLKIQKPVVISLSYSSAIVVDMSLPKIIVAPLVKMSDSDPVAAAKAAQWETFLSLNPFLSSMLIRQFRDESQRQFWSSRYDANAAEYGKLDRELFVEGASHLSRAVEDFDLKETNFSRKQEHLFVLAEHESQIMLKGQVETVLSASRSAKTRVIFVRKAYHNIPESQPQAYVQAVQTLLEKNTSLKNIEVGMISEGKLEWLDESAIKTLFDKILQYPDSTDHAGF